MKVYLAGPMTGVPLMNHPAFDAAAVKLRAAGHEVYSPPEEDRKSHGQDIASNPDHINRRRVLSRDLIWICEHAEALAFLPGWKNSTGATAERAVGIALNLQLIYLD